ncbi:biotin transporter BioY [Niallia sp. NCCP-28]|uniref:biotin transporter BioY n=1 Tax=Niallia sp. NCCP-28 TaxID=2934712 RepID=UPI00207F5C86|nr:BioY family transporter [Niallia sp. NCCP-28]
MKQTKKWKTIEITMIALFVAFTAIGANIGNFFIIGGVPLTLQTFFAILAGLVLGKRLGSMAMIAYMFVGLVGLPIFSQFGGGFRVIFSPTFGFILSYIIVSYVVGFMIEKKATLPMFIFSSIVGLILNYVIGTNWMYFAYKFWAAAPEGFTYGLAWSWMLVFLVKDVIVSIFAGVVGHRLNKTVMAKSSLKIN